MKRIIHHEEGSILNVMTLIISKSDNTEPHFNKERDEVVFVIEGSLKILFDSNKNITLSSTDKVPWHLIKANTTHQIIPLTDKVELLEVIGGLHKQDSCIITQFKS